MVHDGIIFLFSFVCCLLFFFCEKGMSQKGVEDQKRGRNLCENCFEVGFFKSSASPHTVPQDVSLLFLTS